jgi:hypothetical protein
MPMSALRGAHPDYCLTLNERPNADPVGGPQLA